MRQMNNITTEVKDNDTLTTAMMRGIVKGSVHATLIFGGISGVITIISKYLIG